MRLPVGFGSTLWNQFGGPDNPLVSNFLMVTTVAALKALPKKVLGAGYGYFVAGYYAANDGGGGLYYCVTTSPGADNGGTIIWSNTSGYFFVLQNQASFGMMNALQFGADPTGSADSSTAIQKAHDALGGNGGVLVTPGGSLYKINVQIDWGRSNSYLYAYGARFTSTAAITLFDFSQNTLAGIEGAFIDVTGNSAPLGFAKVSLDSQRCFFVRCEITGNQSSNSNFKGIELVRANETQITGCRFGGVGNKLKGSGVYIGTASTANSAGNATWIRENRFSNCDNGVILANGNSVLSNGNNYEGNVQGINIVQDTENAAYGFVSKDDRFEQNTKGIFDNRTTDVLNGQPPQLIDPIYTLLGNGALLDNPNNMTWAGRLQNGDTFGTSLVQVANPSGSVQIVDTNTTATITFPTNYPESGPAYLPFLTVVDVSGTPATKSAKARNKTSFGFDIVLDVAPGTGNTVVVDWFIRR